MNTRKFLLLIVVAFAFSSHASEVKMSNSKICHDTSSPYYEKTTKYTVYEDLKSCLEAGGRPPKGKHVSTNKQLHQKTSSQSFTGITYNRDDYEHWIEQKSGLNTRHELLKQQSTVPVILHKKKYVKHGRWISPFTGKVHTSPRSLHVDHVVPIKWANDRGGFKWSSEKKKEFANDFANLVIVEASLNTQKSANGPDQWLPPANECQYLYRFDRVVKAYQLDYKPLEAKVIGALIDNCKAG